MNGIIFIAIYRPLYALVADAILDCSTAPTIIAPQQNNP